jgi:hypothetical protein
MSELINDFHNVFCNDLCRFPQLQIIWDDLPVLFLQGKFCFKEFFHQANNILNKTYSAGSKKPKSPVSRSSTV